MVTERQAAIVEGTSSIMSCFVPFVAALSHPRDNSVPTVFSMAISVKVIVDICCCCCCCCLYPGSACSSAQVSGGNDGTVAEVCNVNAHPFIYL
jgi:hypothetical protein